MRSSIATEYRHQSITTDKNSLAAARRVLFLAHFVRRSFLGDLFRFCRLKLFKPSDQFETGEGIGSSIIYLNALP